MFFAALLHSPFVARTYIDSLMAVPLQYMPFDGNKWQVQKLVPYRDLVRTIQTEFPDFERVTSRDDPNDTSKHWHVPGHQGTVGFITRYVSRSDSCGIVSSSSFDPLTIQPMF